MSRPDDDFYFARYLGRKGPLSDLYREDKGVPPRAAVDNAILKSAEAEALRRRKPARRGWWRRLSIAAPVFATVTLAVALSFIMSDADKEPAADHDEDVPSLRQPSRPSAGSDGRPGGMSAPQSKTQPGDVTPKIAPLQEAADCAAFATVDATALEPTARIRQIRAAMKQGCEAQAIALRERFEHDFPSFRLPEDVR